MARLLNSQTNLLEDVPDNKVQEVFLSGAFKFKRGVPVPVLNQDGTPGTIPAEEAERAFKAGFTFEGSAVRTARERKEEFGDSPLAAGAAGFARGATLGFSDFVLTKSGLVPQDTLKGLQEENLATSIASEIAGVAGPLLFPEPASTVAGAARLPFLAARAARLAGAAPRAVARVGKAVESGVALKTGSKVASTIAAGGVEGALFSASQIISEQALGDPELVAEQTLADKGLRVLELAGQGAILGAALPATISATRLAGKIVSPVTKEVRARIKNAVNLENVKAFGERQAAKSLGANAKQTSQMMRKVGGLEQMGRDVQDAGFKTVGDLDALTKHVDLLGARIGRGYAALDEAAVAAKALPKTSEWAGFLKREALDPIAKDPTTKTFHSKLSNDLKVRVKNLEGRKSVTFAEMWDAMQKIDDTINYKDLAAKGYNNAARGYRDAMRNFIDDHAERVRGKGFIAEFKEDNRKYSSMKFAEEIVFSATARQSTNRSFSLTDHLGAILLGQTSGSFLVGLSAAALNKFVVRDRGNQILATTANKISKLSILQKGVRETDEKADKAIAKFLGKAPRPAAIAAGAVLLDTLDLSEDGEKLPEGRAERVNHQVEKMSQLVSDPERLAERISASLGDIANVAPGISALLTGRMTQALEYLIERAPKRFGASPLFGSVFLASNTQASRWERYLRAANDPLTALDDVAGGRLTPEAIETLQTLYPALFERLKQKIVEAVAENPDAVDHRTRVQLALLFGQPLEPTTEPGFLAAVQGRYAQQRSEADVDVPGNAGGPVAEQRKSARISQRALENLETPATFQTETQRIAEGG